MGDTQAHTLDSDEIHTQAACVPHEAPDVATSSDDYARRFAGAAGRYFLEVQARGVARLMRDLPVQDVLEVGGGHGQLVATFQGHGCALTLFGSDESTHRRVRTSFPEAQIQFATGDLTNLPYPDRSFDLVASVRLVSHVPDWEKLIAELCRVSRHSIIIDYPSWRSLNALTPVLFHVKKSLEGNTRIYTSFLPSRLAEEFGRNGFKVSASFGQFFLPMFVHRALWGMRWLQWAERFVRRLGLTALFGSPVLLRADRVQLSEPHGQSHEIVTAPKGPELDRS